MRFLLLSITMNLHNDNEVVYVGTTLHNFNTVLEIALNECNCQ